MDDLSQQISQILSDPASMQQLQSVISSLGITPPAENSSPPSPANQPADQAAGTGPDLSALAGALNALGGLGAGQKDQQQSALAGLGGSPQMLSMVTKLAPLLGQINQEDDSTRLLRALRPLLGPERQKKVDEAMKILQMMRLLPLLKESGVFSGLLSGLL